MGASGVMIAHMLHFKRFSLHDLKTELVRRGVPVRLAPEAVAA
jgi:hypothetical protein